jgi:hypothetical protein
MSCKSWKAMHAFIPADEEALGRRDGPWSESPVEEIASSHYDHGIDIDKHPLYSWRNFP